MSDEIEEAQTAGWKSLRDPTEDEDREKKPEWLVMLGVCTHLGCVPISESGDYRGWLCLCHGSHYGICEFCSFVSLCVDLTLSTAGRMRKGPAPVRFSDTKCMMHPVSWFSSSTWKFLPMS